MKRLDCLDGLRGALAVYVMLGHMAPFAAVPGWLAAPLSHGGAAVDVFFMLSGLVIVGSLDTFAYQPRPFLIARVARIFPVYLPMLALAAAVQPLPTGFARMPWIGPDSPARAIWSSGWPASWPADLTAHLTMTHGLLPNGVAPDIWVSLLGAAWSLSTEWQFYALALLLGWAGLRGPRLALVFIGLAIAGVAWQGAAPEAWQFSRAFLPNKAQYFTLGIASTALLRREPRATGFYVRMFGLTVALSVLQGGADKALPPLVWTMCLLAQRHGGNPLASVLRWRPLLRLGAWSYGIYLANEPIQKLLGVGLAWLAAGHRGLFTLLWVPLAVGLPIAAAAWLHGRVERPAQRWGRTLAERSRAVSARPPAGAAVIRR
jgi:peptidoglycan/LPS O-acetylase OafA/YrhL